MSGNISASISVAKIDKGFLKEGRDGQKYLDCVLIPRTEDKYGNDFMIVQSIPKALRDAGQRGPILGNAKFFGGAKKNDSPPSRPPREPEDDGDIPF
jgi:hypothetical protein